MLVSKRVGLRRCALPLERWAPGWFIAAPLHLHARFAASYSSSSEESIRTWCIEQ